MVIATRIGSAIRGMVPGLASLTETAFLLGGATLIAFGAYQVYAPAGDITGGVLLIAGTILRARGKD
jgi:hypothetical protein